MKEMKKEAPKKGGMMMSKPMMIGVGVVVVLALAVYMIMPPSPEAYCNKVVKLSRDKVAKATGIDASKMTEKELIGKTKEECVKDEGRKSERQGLLKYGKYSKCVMRSSTLDEAQKCK